jgi:hypothetical protein
VGAELFVGLLRMCFGWFAEMLKGLVVGQTDYSCLKCWLLGCSIVSPVGVGCLEE